MSDSKDSSGFLFSSWLRNAEQWIGMLSDDPFPAIKYSADHSALEIITSLKPTNVLDIGSTDGALVDMLSEHQIEAIGIEGIKEFAEYANQKMKGSFIYAEQLSELSLLEEHSFDLISFNFGLYMDERLADNLCVAKKWLKKGGLFVLQSIHPSVIISEKKNYEKGWLANLWNHDENEGPSNPFPVYFRTLHDWSLLFSDCGLVIQEMNEFGAKGSKYPDSILFILSLK